MIEIASTATPPLFDPPVVINVGDLLGQDGEIADIIRDIIANLNR